MFMRPHVLATIVTLMTAHATANEAVAPLSNTELDQVVETFRSEGPDVALPGFQQLRTFFAQTGQKSLEARTVRYIGESHWLRGEFELAQEALDQALALARAVGDQEGEASTLNVIGLLEWDTGNYDAARTRFATVSRIAAEIGDPELEGMALNNDSLVLDELGEYESALAGYHDALEMYRAIGFERGIGDTLGNIAGLHLLLGRYGEALDGYRQALAVSEKLDSKPAMTIDHGNIGLVHFALGNDEAAAAHFDRALQFAAETGMSQETAYWRRAKGNLLVRMGRYDEGLDLHREALAALENSDARGLLVDAVRDFGQLHLELGDTASAEQQFLQALELARAIGAEPVVTATLISLGDLHTEAGRLDEAAALYGQARGRAEEAGESSLVLDALLKEARVQRELGRSGEADMLAEKALSRARTAGAARAEIQALLEQCEGAIGADMPEAAVDRCTRAVTALGEAIDPELRWQIHFARGRAYHRAGRLSPAIEELQSAVAIIESVRDRLRADRFRAGYVEDKYEVYVALVRMLLEAGRTGPAFAMAERLRARSLLLQFEQALIASPGSVKHERERELRARIRQLQGALIDEQEQPRATRRQAALDSFSSALLEAEREYQAFLDDREGDAAPRPGVDVPTPAEVRKLLGPRDILVEFVVANDALITFALRNEDILAISRPVSREQLQAGVTLVRELVQQPENDLWRRPAEHLADILIQPLLDRDLLAHAEHLYVVPHGALHYLPFSILPLTADELLVDRHTLAYLPAAAALRPPHDDRERQDGLLALTPDRAQLKWADEEIRLVRQSFPGPALTLTGKAATESLFKARAARYDVLHLATHGYFNRLHPLLSGLELEADATDNGLLEVHEILRLPLNASLVTLSACQTAMGSGHFREFPAGDDFVGLARAFLVAGSDAVLASLWPVDDRSTAELMQNFYTHRARAEGQVSRALAQAQRELRKSDAFSHPFFWAPFVTVGALSRNAGHLAAHRG